MSDAREAGGFANVWLCSPVGHQTMPRLGGVLEMTAPTWWWSPGRHQFTRARATFCTVAESALDLTGRVAKCELAGAPTPLAPADFSPCDRGFDIETSRFGAVEPHASLSCRGPAVHIVSTSFDATIW